jgi:hypothetical protein
MKLRLQTNSLRLRLKRREVAQLIKDGSVEEVITFGSDQTLRYRVQTSPTVKAPQAIFAVGEIDVAVPVEMAQQWALGDGVGIEASQPAGENPLQILIEKDFACLNGNDEQNVDTFPNPLAGTPC